MQGYLKFGLLGVIAYFFTPSVLGSPGTEWLESQLNTDGSFQNAGGVATPFQSTAETLHTFGIVADAVSVDTAASLQFINDEVFNNTENLSRKIIANAAAGGSVSGLIGQLLQHRNVDGGFGDLTGYESNPLDTAFALGALAVAGELRNPAAGSAVGYLLNSQQAGGGWSLGGNEPSVYVTALALRAVWQYRNIFSVENNVERARAFLLGRRDADGLWGEVFESALSLIAIVPSLIDRSGVENSVNALRQLQQANGSFGDDVYQTALALRALRLAELPSPDEILVRGRVLDGDTNLPLTGVVVSLAGPATLAQTTGNNGEFRFAGLQPGSYQLTLSLENYSPLSTSVSLPVGRQLDFGDLRMLPAAASPTTGAVIGTVTSAESGEPLANVQISLAGAGNLTATTTANGAYQIVNIPPGAYTLQAGASGYLTATGSATINAGQTLVFSPQLTPLADVAVSVQGIVTGRDTGEPLSGVEISVQGSGNAAGALTSATGEYRIDGLQPGDLILTASLTGFQTVAGTITASQGARINFSPALTPEGQVADPQPGGVIGMVVDRATGEGLPGVNVTLETASGPQLIISGSDGEFSFSAIEAGPATLSFEATGFQPRSATIEIADNTIIDLGEVELLPSGFQETAGIVGRVIDARTEQPLQGVTVDVLLNAGNRGFVTAGNGLFEFLGLTDLSGVVNFALPGYEPVSLNVTLTTGTVLDLGDVRLRDEDIDVLLPDAAIQALNADSLVSDPRSFAVSGQLSVTVVNRGNAAIDVPLDVLAFYDADNDALFDPGVDSVLGESRITDTIPPDATVALTVDVGGDLPFRDAPVSVWVDSGETLAEPSEVNNIESTAGLCARQNAPTIDLAFCLDGSGSVSAADFRLQLEGTARAVENPDIMPQDGSVRISVIQFASGSRVELVPTIVESDNVGNIAGTIRGIPKLGGGTSIHSCIDTARTQIVAATPLSAQQVIDVSTDGGSSLSAALAAVGRAQQAGIDTLNAIGVGSANIGLLNQIVFPQPAGGDRGFVIDVNTFDEYVTALSGKVQQEVQIADLTIGGLMLVDNGAGQPVSLSAVVGNGGSGASPAGIIVSFYAGDPDTGGALLGSVTLDALGSGEFVDARIDGLDAGLLNVSDIFAIVDLEDALAECGEQNNRISTPVGTTLGQISLVSDRAVYLPGADAVFTIGVANNGAVAGQFVVDLVIADTQGNTVTTFNGLSVGLLAGGASIELGQTWNTGATVAGNYTATAVLRNVNDGAELDQAALNFAIDEAGATPGGIVTLRTTTDRQTYHTSDTAVIENLLQNISVSTFVSGSTLQLTISDPGNVTVFNEQLPVNSLSPGGLLDLFSNFTFSGLSEGTYTVLAELRGGMQTLATGTAQFDLVENLSLSLAGSAEAQRPTLFAGETQVCNYSVDNTGTLNLQGQSLWQVLVNVNDQTEVDVAQVAQDIDAGESASFIRSHDTGGLPPGDYACVLQATVNGERQSLAHAVFRLEEAPVNLNVDFSLGDRGRLLVLLDEDKRHCHGKDHDHDHDRHDRDRKHDHDKRHDKKHGKGDGHDRHDGKYTHKHGWDKHDNDCRHGDEKQGYGHREYPRLSEQRAWLEQALDEAGWSYTIVTDKHDFSRELRSGGYTVYALLSEAVKLDNTTLEELREAVFRGEGLLVAGGHDERNSKIDAVLGIKLAGKTRATGIAVLDTEFHDAVESDFSESRHVLKARREGADVYARFTGIDRGDADGDRDRKHHHKDRDNGRGWYDWKDLWRHDDDNGYGHGRSDADIAVTGNAYGEGRAVYMGFDLLREAAVQATVAPDNLFKELLLHALDSVHPEMITPAFGDVLPLRLTVENLGIDTPGRAVITLPAGSRVPDSGAAIAGGEDQLTWSFNLASGETAGVTIYVLPPYDGLAPQVFEALIQTGQAPDFADYDTVELTVAPAASPDVDAVLSAIDALSHVDHAIRQADHHLRDAQRQLDRERYEQALDALLKATDKLIQSRHARAAEIRLQVDALIRAVARQASAASNDRHHGWNKGGRDHD